MNKETPGQTPGAPAPRGNPRQDRLRTSEELLDEVGHIAQIGGWEMDLVTREARWTRGTYEIVGIEPGTPPPGPDEHLRYYIEEDRPLVAKAMRALVEDDVPLDFEARARLEHKGIRWFRALGRAVRVNGRCVRLVGTLQDITEYKQARDALQASEARYRMLFDTSADGILIADIETKIFTQANPAICRMLGYTEAELKTMGVADIHPKKDLPRALAEFEAQGRKEKAVARDIPCLRKDGSVVYADINTSTVTINGRTCNVGLFRDITERKRAEEALQSSETRFRTLSECAPIGIYLTDKDGNCTYVNRAWREASGLSLDEALGQGWINGLHPEDRATIGKSWYQSVQSNGRWGFEYRFLNKAGRVTWVYGTAAAQYAADGTVMGYVGTNIDITDRKHTDEALRESEEKYRQLVEDSIEGIGISQGDRIIYANHALLRIFGYESLAEFIARPLMDHVAPESRELILKERENRVRREFPTSSFEYKIIRKDGTIRDLEISATTISMNGQSFTQSTFRDITDRKRAEEAARESEERIRAKLNAILLPEGDIGVLNLSDIVDIPAIQAMMNDFYNLTGIGVAIVDMQGKVLVATGWQDICTKFHRVHPETRRHCEESDTILSDGVAPGTFKLYRCSNNLWDMATPITLGGRHAGNMFLGQFFFSGEQPDVEVFRAQARQYGFDEKEYLAALDRVPRWSREKVDRVMTFYAAFAKLISELSYSNIKLGRTLTERERAEDELKRSLAEKDALLREVHHRVKNNLQVIASLMDLQSAAIKNKEARQALGESKDRVQFMARLHQQLYLSQDLANIHVDSFFQNIAGFLQQTYDMKKIVLKNSAEKLWLTIDTAIPCGLIVNELITNALKHAFTPESEGEIGLYLKKEEAEYELCVYNNGAPLPAGFDIQQAGSLGLRLVRLLTRQLGGTLSVESGNKTAFKIRFPV